jgi:hypothetical protein
MRPYNDQKKKHSTFFMLCQDQDLLHNLDTIDEFNPVTFFCLLPAKTYICITVCRYLCVW